MLGQSKTAYQAEIDAACELIDFWRYNVHFARQILAEQPQSVAGRLEPGRPPPARGLRLRDHAVQLHRDRRQPADRAGAHGQHRRLEALADPAVRRALPDAAARGGGPAAGRHQHGHRRRDRRSPRSRWPTATSPASTSPARRRSSSTCGGRSGRTSPPTAATRGSWGRPAARTSSSRTPRPTSTCCAPRWSAAPSSSRARSARRPPAPTSRAACGPRLRDDLVATTESLPMGDVTDFSNFMGAVIDRKSFSQALRRPRPGEGRRRADRRRRRDRRRQRGLLRAADDHRGHRPRRTRCSRTEYFGPVLAVHVYDDADYDAVLAQMESVAPYALTGSVIAQDRAAIAHAQHVPAQRGRQLLRQRQADRRRRRPAAVRRRAGLGHQRQGRRPAEPAALDEHPVDQGDLRPGDRPPLPAHGLSP